MLNPGGSNGAGELTYVIDFQGSGVLLEGSSLAPLSNRGMWGSPADAGLYQISATPGTPASTLPDGMANGVFYDLPRQVTWTIASAGPPTKRFQRNVLTIRRKSDNAVVATTTLQNVEIGVNAECT